MNLLYAGRDAVKLTERFGLPLHAYDARRISENLKSFQSVLQDTEIEGAVCYAVKACGFPEIVGLAARVGAGADVASEYELETALPAGIPPGKLVIHGNAKSGSYIQKTIALDALIVANHHKELERIEAEAGRQRKIAKVLLRLSGFDLGPVTAKGIFTAGHWCKFGEPVAAVPALLKSCGKWPHIDLLGFHVHIGSQITEAEPYQKVMGIMAESALLYREIAGRPVKVIDLGGGFPVSYVDQKTWHNVVRGIRRQHEYSLLTNKGKNPRWKIPPNPPFSKGGARESTLMVKGTPGLPLLQRGNEGDLKIGRVLTWEGMTGGFQPDPKTGKIDWSHWSGEKFYAPYPKEGLLARLLQGRIPFAGREEPFKKVWEKIGKPELIVEPGRAIVGDAGITLARVVDVYPLAGGHPLVTLDLGIVNHGTGLVEPDLYSWTLANEPDRKDPRPFRAFVAGRLCFSGDMLSRYRVTFPRRPVRGDIAVIGKTGAYAPTFFASRANGFPLPGFVLLGARKKVVSMKFIS